MFSKEVMGGGAVVVGVLMAATQYLGWNGQLHYLWALLVIVWGILAYMDK